MEFSNVIESEAALRDLMGEPVSPLVVAKTLSALDRHCEAFIARAPFVMLATSDAEGRLDISPKGDAPGFVQVLDQHTLAIPDRPGNQRFDSFRNLLQSPRVGLIFLIPGKRETLRISGSARIVADPALRERMAANGKVPALAIVITVEEAFFHCAKCMVRSQLWQPEHWPALDGLPSLAETMKDATDFDAPVEFIDERVREDERERLY
jgi:PPOX class probable FMN-dependent enzyme